MSGSSRKFCGGFTYLAALFMIMIMGIMLGAIGQSWSALMKREREEELFFRGSQIREAISRWNDKSKTGHPVTPLAALNDLVKDPRSLQIKRYLRRIYPDPLTGKDWNIIKDPVKGIIGVASSSEEKPLKQAGFTEEYKTLAGKSKYSEWLFVFNQAQQPVPTKSQPSSQPPQK